MVGSGGLVLPVVPGHGACLRCVFPDPPPPGSLPTCDSAGVILPAVGAVASLQAGAALRLLGSDRKGRVGLEPHLIEVYERTMRETDQICDAPTIELLDDIVRKKRRHVTWGKEVLDRLCDTDAKRERRVRREQELVAQLELCGGVTGELAVARA